MSKSWNLPSVLVMCGVKPHRVDTSLEHINERISKREKEEEANTSSAATADDVDDTALTTSVIAQVVADDILKKKREDAATRKPSATGDVEQQQHPHPLVPPSQQVDAGSTSCTVEFELPLLRVKRAMQIFSKKRSLIVFIGGPTGAGKSTLASQLAGRLGIASCVLSTDSVRESLRANPAAVAAVPDLAFSTFESVYNNDNTNSSDDDARNCSTTTEEENLHGGEEAAFQQQRRLIQSFQRQCDAVLKVVERYLDGVIERGESVVIEGVHLLPSWTRMMTMKLVTTTTTTHSGGGGADSQSCCPIVVPVFAFVGGSSRHMHRFAWRRSRGAAAATAEEEEDENHDNQNVDDDNSKNEAASASSPPSLHPDVNRYVGNFDRIRMIHHWLLSEVGRWFVHADIDELVQSIMMNNHHDDNSSHNTSTSPESDDNNKNCWKAWRERAKVIVQLVRAPERVVTSALTPVFDNVNLDRSVNFTHRALQVWLDSAELEVACQHAMPHLDHFHHPTSVESNNHRDEQQHHDNNEDDNYHTEKMLLDKWNDTLKRSDGGTTIAEYLQKRRRERGSRSRNKKLEDGTSSSPQYFTDGTSSGDDGGGSIADHEVT